MHLKQIAARNFKGRNFDHLLNPITIIHGDNFSGKSAIADAIRVGLIGYHPHHGKRPCDTFGFAGAGTTMEISGDVGLIAFTHKWEMKRGSVSFETSAPSSMPMVPEVLLDIREYLKLSGPNKARFVFAGIDLEAMGFTTEMITARMKKDVKVDEPSEASERFLNEIVDDIEGLGQERDELKKTHQEWIAGVVARIKEKRDDAKEAAKSMEGTIQGTAQLRAKEGINAAANPSETLKAKRAELQEMTLARQKAEDTMADRAKAESRLKTLEAAYNNASDPAMQIKVLEESVAKLTKRIDGYQSRTEDILEKHGQANAALGAANQTIERIKSDVSEVSDNAAAALEEKCCPMCKSKGAGWKKSLIKSRDADLKKLADEMVEAKKQHKDAKAKLDKLAADLEASRSRDNEIAMDRKTKTQQEGELKKLRAAQTEMAGAAARIDEARKAYQLYPNILQEQIDAAKASEASLKLIVENFEAEERRYIARMADAKRAAQAEIEFTEKKIELDVCERALKVVLAIQNEMMTQAFDGFLFKVNTFCDGILPGTIAFKDGEIGYYAGAAWAAAEFFSGTEELLCFAGLAVALAQQSPIKIVIMDELGRMTVANKMKLIRKMIDLQKAGVIDQFVGIDVEPGVFANFPEVGLVKAG